MKKFIAFLTIIISFIFNISNVHALDIKVDNVKVLDKSDTITVNTTTTSGLTITPKITFHNVSDYVIYKITFSGTDISKYEIAKVADNNTSEYIKTSYKYDKTLSSPLYITIKYQNATSNLSLNDINVSITLTGEGGAVVINDPGNGGGNSGSNPQTGAGSIIIPILILIITIPLINYYVKYNKENTIASIILIGLIIIPITVIAASTEKINLVIKVSNISIGDSVSKPSSSSSSSSKPSSSSSSSSSSKPSSSSSNKYYVLLYPNGGTGISDGYKLEYTNIAYFTSFPSVTKSGCSLTGWNVGSTSGKLYKSYVDSSDSGQKLYAHWDCGGGGTNYDQDTIISRYKDAGGAYMNFQTTLSCTYYLGDGKTVSKGQYVNSTIKSKMETALAQVCVYLRNNNIYGTVNIQSGGIYAETSIYPHKWGMGIDLFNLWTYNYNGKTYRPYGSYANSTNYRKFICEVCNGDYRCDKNLNYQIYERIFKPLGFCWGGYWKEQYFDPMHFEYDIKKGNCGSTPQISLNC